MYVDVYLYTIDTDITFSLFFFFTRSRLSFVVLRLRIQNKILVDNCERSVKFNSRALISQTKSKIEADSEKESKRQREMAVRDRGALNICLFLFRKWVVKEYMERYIYRFHILYMYIYIKL